MPASNMSVQPRATDSEGRLIDRPSMKQDSHPEHNMPASEHDGETKTMYSSIPTYEQGAKMDKSGQ